MDIREYIDMEATEKILRDWTKITGMTCVIVDEEEQVVISNIDREIEGLQPEFTKELYVEDNYYVGKLMAIIDSSEEDIRKAADEAGVDQEAYMLAWNAMHADSKEDCQAGINLLGEVIASMVANAYFKNVTLRNNDKVTSGIENTVHYINNINLYTKNLDKLEKQQKILALNASIESARAGEAGKGFAIVANKVGSLAADFGAANHQIKEELERLTEAVDEIIGQK